MQNKTKNYAKNFESEVSTLQNKILYCLIVKANRQQQGITKTNQQQGEKNGKVKPCRRALHHQRFNAPFKSIKNHDRQPRKSRAIKQAQNGQKNPIFSK